MKKTNSPAKPAKLDALPGKKPTLINPPASGAEDGSGPASAVSPAPATSHRQMVLPSPGGPASAVQANTVDIGETKPLKEVFTAADLPVIDMPPGGSFYVNVQHKCCGMCAATIQMFVGTKEAHTDLVAEAKMPCCCCNCCCQCCCSALCETIIPLFNGQNQRVGEMQLANDCSCVCCLPRIKVFLNGLPGGTAWTRCCACVKCAKRVGNLNSPLIYTGLKCIKDKVCSCLFPCWGLYRGMCTNKTVVESYVSSADPTIQSFEVINVLFVKLIFNLGCGMLWMLLLWR
jgi:hypothetical protein